MKKFVRKKTHPKKLQNTVKNGLKPQKKTTQSFNYTSFRFDSDVDLCAELDHIILKSKDLHGKNRTQKNC